MHKVRRDDVEAPRTLQRRGAASLRDPSEPLHLLELRLLRVVTHAQGLGVVQAVLAPLPKRDDVVHVEGGAQIFAADRTLPVLPRPDGSLVVCVELPFVRSPSSRSIHVSSPASF